MELFQQTSISKIVLPNLNHAKFTKMRATPLTSFSCWNVFFYGCKCYRWTKGTSVKLTLPTGWLWFTLLALQTCNLCSKLTTQTHQLHYPLQERHFPTPLRYREKQQLHWNRTTLPLQSSSLQSPKINVDNPT